jgi:hypothetical protein
MVIFIVADRASIASDIRGLLGAGDDSTAMNWSLIYVVTNS